MLHIMRNHFEFVPSRNWFFVWRRNAIGEHVIRLCLRGKFRAWTRCGRRRARAQGCKAGEWQRTQFG